MREHGKVQGRKKTKERSSDKRNGSSKANLLMKYDGESVNRSQMEVKQL
jgi:hypothetical protein